MKQKHSIIIILAILVAFGFLYLTNKAKSISDQQYELKEKLNDLESRIEDIRQ